MAGCNCDDNVKFDGTTAAYKRILWVVIAINGIMFLVEMTAGMIASSQALKADALDFLGDTATYTITLMVLGMPLVWRARAALVKGASLGLMGIWVLGSTIYYALVLDVPQAEIMGSIGLLALTANMVSVLLLLRHRNGDANVRSVWLCSRNDAIGNLAVIFAASGVWATSSAWPDLIVAGVMASLFLWSSAQIVSQALSELRLSQIDQQVADFR
ncbi:MAG: cation transporter [Parvibaculaceae bacterium]|nr:cation transporter [Parvibaculaceae bacterium]